MTSSNELGFWGFTASGTNFSQMRYNLKMSIHTSIPVKGPFFVITSAWLGSISQHLEWQTV